MSKTNPRIFANVSFKTQSGKNRRFATQRIDAEAIQRLRDAGMDMMADNCQVLLEAVEEDRIGAGEEIPVTMTIGIEGQRVADSIAV